VSAFDIDTMTGHQLRLAQQRHAQIWLRIVGAALSSAQYALLEACSSLAASGTEVDQASAGRLAGIDRSTTAEMVSRLSRQDWLRSTRSTTDRRRQVLELTAPAAAALTWCSPHVDRVQVELMSSLSPGEQVWLLPRWALLAGLDAQAPEQTSPGAGGLQPRPGHLLRRAQQRHLQLWTEKVSAKLTSQQFALLNAAGAAGPEGTSQADLREAAGVDRSSTSHLVTKLVAQDLLERRPDPQDARRRLVALTETGRSMHAELATAAAALQATLLSPLAAADRDRTRDLLRRIADGV
jgi:DNA-binding MarR family transcriptional regulator